jgi:hypothetical protein
MLATLLLALTLFTNAPNSVTQSNTASPATPEVSVSIPAPPENPCADEFSSAVKNDMTGRINEGKPSLTLDPYMGDEILVFQSHGYCQALDEAGRNMTPQQLADSLLADLKANAEENGWTISYVSKLNKVLDGFSVAIIANPPPEAIAQAGIEYRALQVFVFNKTRIVGGQFFVSVTGLKTP